HFRDCKDLRELLLSYTRVSDAGVAHFKGRKGLTALDLTNTRVSDAGLAHFNGCKHLTDLPLGAIRGTCMGRGHCNDCKDLAYVHRAAAGVSDATLTGLKVCRNLTMLYLQRTKATAATIEELKTALPRCRIEWDGGVIEPKAPSDSDRKAAEWVLSIGGVVMV